MMTLPASSNTTTKMNYETVLEDRGQGQRRGSLRTQVLGPRCETIDRQREVSFYCGVAIVR